MLTKMISIKVDCLPLQDIKIIRNLIIDWNLEDVIKYEYSNDDREEYPTITFWIPEQMLGVFIATIYDMGGVGFFRTLSRS